MKRGFTLLEILVSIGIIAVISVLVAQAFFTTTRTNTKAELLKDIKQNGDFALEVMTRMIRNSRQVNSACLGTPDTSLSIMNPDADSTTFRCVLDGTVTRIASDSSAPRQYLTSNNLSLGDDCATAITFICTKPVDSPAHISISFTLSQKGGPLGAFEVASQTFKTTVAARN